MPASSRERQGLALCLASAAGFGVMPVLAKVAYDAGAQVTSLLALRFLLAATVLWGIAAVRRPAWPGRRTALSALALGGIGYAAQAGAFYASLRHLDASLTSLLLYTYPAPVTLAALGLGRERHTRPRVAALGLASAGTVLVLLGGAAGTLDPLGVGLALLSAAAYTAFILVSDSTLREGDPLLLNAVIISGAALTLWIVVAATGGPHTDLDPSGWLALTGIALVSTVAAPTLFLLGLRRVGPGAASIASTFEPVVTVGLAAAFLGDRLAPGQLAGAALVLSAVVVLQVRQPSRVSIRGLAALAARRPAARALARRAS